VTVICPLAHSYLQAATASAGAVAELAATRKVAKYITLEDQYIFQPIAVESLGPMNREARKFLADLGRRISRVFGDDRETTFLFQRIFVSLSFFNFFLPSFFQGFKNNNNNLFKWRLKVIMFLHSRMSAGRSSRCMEQQRRKREVPVRCVCEERRASEHRMSAEPAVVHGSVPAR